MAPPTTYVEIYNELLRGIDTLPPDEARVLDLYYVKSCTWKEICTILGQPYAQVRATYWIAIEKLKPRLQELFR